MPVCELKSKRFSSAAVAEIAVPPIEYCVAFTFLRSPISLLSSTITALPAATVPGVTSFNGSNFDLSSVAAFPAAISSSVPTASFGNCTSPADVLLMVTSPK